MAATGRFKRHQKVMVVGPQSKADYEGHKYIWIDGMDKFKNKTFTVKWVSNCSEKPTYELTGLLEGFEECWLEESPLLPDNLFEI